MERQVVIFMDKETQLREDALAWFCEKARAKYDKGQQEHGGYLVDRVQFMDMGDEIFDLVFYFYSLLQKRKSGDMHFVPGANMAIMGVGNHGGQNLLVYDRDKLIEVFQERDGMNYQEASEWVDTQFGYCGPGTPVVLDQNVGLDDIETAE